MVMFISDFIVDRGRVRPQRSEEATVLQSYGMHMREEVPRHDKRETNGSESESRVYVASTKHKKTTVETAVSIYFFS